MTQPWSEQQRQAIRGFRQAIVARVQREREIADGAQSRQQATQQHYEAERNRVQKHYARGEAEAVTRAEVARLQMKEHHERERQKLQREHQKGKAKILHDYNEAKVKL